MSPDWADKPEAVPYSDHGDPQSLNLYGYVRNNPLSQADADGHCYPSCTTGIGAGVGAITGAGAEILGQKLTGEAYDGRKVFNAAVGGGLAGAITGIAGPEAGLGAKVFFGALGSGLGGGVERTQNGEKAADPVKVGIDIAAGGLGGAVDKGLEKMIPPVTAGTTISMGAGGSYSATIRDAETAATENVARNVIRTGSSTVLQTASGTTANLVKDHVSTTPTTPAPRIELVKSH